MENVTYDPKLKAYVRKLEPVKNPYKGDLPTQQELAARIVGATVRKNDPVCL